VEKGVAENWSAPLLICIVLMCSAYIICPEVSRAIFDTLWKAFLSPLTCTPKYDGRHLSRQPVIFQTRPPAALKCLNAGRQKDKLDDSRSAAIKVSEIDAIPISSGEDSDYGGVDDGRFDTMFPPVDKLPLSPEPNNIGSDNTIDSGSYTTF
jgi:hypothetical protein